VRIKQRPGDFVVKERFHFDEAKRGEHYVYRLSKEKLTTFTALEMLRERFRVPEDAISFCGLKDKQGRTEQAIAVRGGKLPELTEPNLRLEFLGRSAQALGAENLLGNWFGVVVRDLAREEADRAREACAEVRRAGSVNYFDSQRFGFVKHGQGFIGKLLVRGELEAALKAWMATPSPLDRSDDGKVKAFFREHWGAWKARPPPLPAARRYERVLRRLRERPRDFGYALLAVPGDVRAMMVFEYQSFLWNEGMKRWIARMAPARDLVGLKYTAGSLLFHRELPAERAGAMRAAAFPLLGPGAELADPDVRAAVDETLNAERVRLEDLKVPGVPQIFFRPEPRAALVFPPDLEASPPRPDDENRGRFSVRLTFTCPPGAYGTLVTKRVFWFAVERGVKPRRRGRS
jgi:tRNA pseudouridine13 synthase